MRMTTYGKLSRTGGAVFHGKQHSWWQKAQDKSLAELFKKLKQHYDSHRHCSVPSVWPPVSVWSLQCKPGHSCRGYSILHWTVYLGVVYPWPWLVNIERRVHPVLKTTLMSNSLQTHLMSSLIPAIQGSSLPVVCSPSPALIANCMIFGHLVTWH